jgi:translation initiation factor IF-1
MVKNKVGGNRAKKQGRKHQAESVTVRKVRFSEDNDEIYACCEKFLGGDQCLVKCIDNGKQRLCMIRKKFRGRHKTDNKIVIGTWLLVGKRNYQTFTKSGHEICDLLEVYRNDEIDSIKLHHPEKIWDIFKGIGNAFTNHNQENNDDDIGIDITNNYTTNDIVKPDDFIQEETFLGDDEDDDICFDDI